MNRAESLWDDLQNAETEYHEAAAAILLLGWLSTGGGSPADLRAVVSRCQRVLAHAVDAAYVGYPKLESTLSLRASR